MRLTGATSDASNDAGGEGSAVLFIDCEPIGEAVVVDRDGNRFFEGVRVNELEIRRFDCVKVFLEVRLVVI
jgi:hypothetical protein